VARSVLRRAPVACEVVKSTVEQSLGAADLRGMHAGLMQVMPTADARRGIDAFARKERIDFGDYGGELGPQDGVE
jgi:hypothetical protein